MAFLIAYIVISPAFAQVSQDQFNQTLNGFSQAMTPWVQTNYGQVLEVHGDWSKELTPTSAGANAFRPNFHWGVYVAGWLARFQGITADALNLILCHELGHHIHGLHREVEPDHFAVSVCLVQIWGAGRRSVQGQPQNCAGSRFSSEYCHRAVAAAEQVNQFRMWFWRRAEVRDADRQLTCRQQTFRRAARGLDYQDCESKLSFAADLGTCSGAVVYFQGHPAPRKAYLLTNGHCVRTMRPNQVYYQQPSQRQVWLFRGEQKITQPFTVNKLVYATMSGTDIALYELRENKAELESRWGVKVSPIAQRLPPAATWIAMPSGRFQRNSTCELRAGQVSLREGEWSFANSLSVRGESCHFAHGHSGSPLISPLQQHEVFAVANTYYEGGTACSRNNPCEATSDGATSVHRGRIYAQPVVDLYKCLDSRGEFDLYVPGCELPKP